MKYRTGTASNLPISITEFESHFIAQLPQTYQLLRRANLVVHPAVSHVILHGSRGLAGHARPDSDVDLSLVLHPTQVPAALPAREHLLRMLLGLTLGNWEAGVDLDLAAIFDVRGCGLRCFDRTYYDARPCRWGNGVDCFGVYKIRTGYHGYVRAGVQVRRMYPCIRIWRNRAYPVGET